MVKFQLKSNVLQEGQWRWERRADSVRFTAWYENQPDNHNHNGVTEDCMHMYNSKKSPQRLWNDHVCIADQISERGIHPLCQRFF